MAGTLRGTNGIARVIVSAVTATGLAAVATAGDAAVAMPVSVAEASTQEDDREVVIAPAALTNTGTSIETEEGDKVVSMTLNTRIHHGLMRSRGAGSRKMSQSLSATNPRKNTQAGKNTSMGIHGVQVAAQAE